MSQKVAGMIWNGDPEDWASGKLILKQKQGGLRGAAVPFFLKLDSQASDVTRGFCELLLPPTCPGTFTQEE